ncbi:MAG: alpha/beta fold hydrolase [Actinomycetota bacterium]
MPVHRVRNGEVELNVWDEGAGRPVLLIHGFPDSSYMWRKQVPELVRAGFRTLAVDLRGFGLSDRPQGVAAYGMARVMSDLIAILDYLEVDRAHVVGHDWGSVTAWGLAGWHSERVDRLVALCVGHPRSFIRAGPRQMLRSWYTLAFQVPRLPERAMRARDWALFRKAFGGSRDLARYLEDLSRPGALTAGLNWYRANAHPWDLLRYPAVHAETLGILGTNDWAVTEAQMTGSWRYVEAQWTYERVEGGHWLPLSRAAIVNQLLVDFLSAR